MSGFQEKTYTLVFVRDAEKKEILLGQKKRGFGLNKWNGYGGKQEGEETIVMCAKRELEEESSLIVDEKDLEYMGFIVFVMHGHQKIMNVHIYQAYKFEGTPIETDEMRPKWVKESEIDQYYDLMWPDDRYHLPLLLKGKRFIGRFEYDSDDETILEANLKEQ